MDRWFARGGWFLRQRLRQNTFKKHRGEPVGTAQRMTNPLSRGFGLVSYRHWLKARASQTAERRRQDTSGPVLGVAPALRCSKTPGRLARGAGEPARGATSVQLGWRASPYSDSIQ